MELLRIVGRRSFLSEVIYTVLNIVFAVALLLIILYTDSIPLAVALVAVSKFRVLAVRPRFWFANVQANLVDFIVSLSVVLGLYMVHNTALGDTKQLLVMLALTLFYIIWLLVIKPRSKRIFVVAQAGLSLFTGVSALFMVSYGWPLAVVVLIMWLIGYATARHVLATYDETHLLFLSLAWGVVMAEIGWVAYHWTIAYTLPFTTNLLLPQVSLIVLSAAFVAYKAYDSLYHHQKIRTNDILLPLLFAVSVIGVLVFVFNNITTAI